MNRIIGCLVLFALAAYVHGTKFTDCGSTSATVASVDVSDCPDTDDTCILYRGTSKTISIKFNSQSESKKVTAVVHGVIGGVPLPFSLPKHDGCKTGLTCPLQNGQEYTYANTLDIKNSYPPISVTVRWELKDDASSDIVCVELSCEIKSK